MSKSQFKNAFVRQMGREFAHSTYKEMGSFDSQISEVMEDTFTGRLVWINYMWIALASFIGLALPYIMVIPFICGLVRIFGNKVWGHYRGLVSNYKYDGRVRGGKRYLGDTETWIKAKRPAEDCTEEQIRETKTAGIIEIIISVLVFALGMYIQYMA